MENLSLAAQIIVALSVLFIWTFRYKIIVSDFSSFNLSDQTRTSVGTLKIALATLMLVGVWHTEIRAVSAFGMAAMMIAAQYFHFRINNPIAKRLPSAVFLAMCVLILAVG